MNYDSWIAGSDWWLQYCFVCSEAVAMHLLNWILWAHAMGCGWWYDRQADSQKLPYWLGKMGRMGEA
jgi:hypothetical protein